MELLAVLALIAMLATLSVPSWSAWRMRDRVEARAGMLLGALALARSEALRLGARVVLCRADAAGQCLMSGQPCAEGLLDWSCDWVVRGEGTAGPPLRRFAGDARIAIASVSTPLGFVPPAGQAVGGFRRFEFAPRVTGFQGARWRRCVVLGAGGRARLGWTCAAE